MKRAIDPDVRLLQAAADPTRLAILRQLSVEGEVCACDFTSCCDVAQPTVSHHLKVLREAGWVDGERRGTWIWYAIRPDALERLAHITGGLRVGGDATAGVLGGGRALLPVVAPASR
jgi:ArsR family transcriptional regulator